MIKFTRFIAYRFCTKSFYLKLKQYDNLTAYSECKKYITENENQIQQLATYLISDPQPSENTIIAANQLIPYLDQQLFFQITEQIHKAFRLHNTVPESIKEQLKVIYNKKVPSSKLIPLSHLFSFIFVSMKWLELTDPPVDVISQIHQKLESQTFIQEELIECLKQYAKFKEVSVFSTQTWKLLLQSLIDNKITTQSQFYSKNDLHQCLIHSEAFKLNDLKIYFDQLIDSEVEFQSQAKHKEKIKCLLMTLKNINFMHNFKRPYSKCSQVVKICRQMERDLIETELNINEYTIFMKQNSQSLPEKLQLQEDQKSVNKLSDLKSYSITNTSQINKNLSFILQQNLKNLTNLQKEELRDVVLEMFKKQDLLEDITIKKGLVLCCIVWPNDIKMIQLAVKELKRVFNEEKIDFTKDKISLAINGLHQLTNVKYDIPAIFKTLLDYLLQAFKSSEERIFQMQLQEANSIFYVMNLARDKQSKGEFYGEKQPKSKNTIFLQQYLEIQFLLVPYIQRMSEKGLFSLKTLYTITDCYSKYQSVQPDLKQNQDYKYLFEKIEYNLVRKIDEEFQLGNKLQLKDIKFLYNRFFFLKVGSRKFMRMIIEMKEAGKDYDKLPKGTPKLSNHKPSYQKALGTYLQREKVYSTMRMRRKQSMDAEKSFK